jgi:hypothetical protein
MAALGLHPPGGHARRGYALRDRVRSRAHGGAAELALLDLAVVTLAAIILWLRLSVHKA